MKKIASSLLLVFALIGCSEKKSFEPTIKNYINEIAGVDMSPTIKELKVVDTVTVEESLHEWYVLNYDKVIPKDSAIAETESLIALLKENNDEMGSNDLKIKHWQHKLKRFNELQSKTGVDYYVVHAPYKIINPLFNNLEVNLDKYFIISNDSVLAAPTKSEMEEYAGVTEGFPNTKYELAMVNK